MEGHDIAHLYVQSFQSLVNVGRRHHDSLRMPHKSGSFLVQLFSWYTLGLVTEKYLDDLVQAVFHIASKRTCHGFR